MKRLQLHRRSIVGGALALAMLAPGARAAEPAPLPEKPFAEHRVVLQLSDNDAKKQGLVISVAYNLLKLYNPNRKLVESLVAQGVKFDICLNTVDTVERDTGKRPQYIPAATPVQVGVGQILALTENGYTLVRP
jgi:uncharacterized protein